MNSPENSIRNDVDVEDGKEQFQMKTKYEEEELKTGELFKRKKELHLEERPETIDEGNGVENKNGKTVLKDQQLAILLPIHTRWIIRKVIAIEIS